MELLTLTALLLLAAYLHKTREQKKRIALLASHPGRYQIETLMENLTEGYLRSDPSASVTYTQADGTTVGKAPCAGYVG